MQMLVLFGNFLAWNKHSSPSPNLGTEFMLNIFLAEACKTLVHNFLLEALRNEQILTNLFSAWPIKDWYLNLFLYWPPPKKACHCGMFSWYFARLALLHVSIFAKVYFSLGNGIAQWSVYLLLVQGTWVITLAREKIFLWVSSGGLYFNYLHQNLESLLIIFAYWTQLKMPWLRCPN